MKHILFFILFITIALVGKAQVGRKPILPICCADILARDFSDDGSLMKKQNENIYKVIPFVLDGDDFFFNFFNVSDSIKKFISNNLIYPDSSKKAGKQGKVYVSFCFDENNKMSEVKILRGLSPDIDKEVLRVFSIIPDWKWWDSPPKKAQKIRLCLPIKFALDD